MGGHLGFGGVGDQHNNSVPDPRGLLPGPPPPADFAGHVTVNIGEPVGSSAVPAPQPSHPLLVPEPESALPALPSATPADPVSVPAAWAADTAQGRGGGWA